MSSSWHSEPLAYFFRPFDSLFPFNFGVQSRFSYLFVHFDSLSFLVLVFRVVLSFLVFRAIGQFVIQCHPFFSLVWRSEPFLISIQAFDVTIFLSFWHSKPSFISTFRAIVHIRLGTLSHHLSIFMTFRVVSPLSYLSESQF